MSGLVFDSSLDNHMFDAYKLGDICNETNKIHFTEMIKGVAADEFASYPRTWAKSNMNHLLIDNNEQVFGLSRNGIWDCKNMNKIIAFPESNDGLSFAKVASENAENLLVCTCEFNRVIVFNTSSSCKVYDEVLSIHPSICRKPFVVESAFSYDNILLIVFSTTVDDSQPAAHACCRVEVQLDSKNYSVGPLYVGTEPWLHIYNCTAKFNVFSKGKYLLHQDFSKDNCIESSSSEIITDDCSVDNHPLAKYTTSTQVDDKSPFTDNLLDEDDDDSLSPLGFYISECAGNVHHNYYAEVALMTTDLNLNAYIGFQRNHDLAIFDYPNLTHRFSFSALSYVASGKKHKKFFMVDPTSTYCVICEHTNHVYVYKKPDPMASVSFQQVIFVGNLIILGTRVTTHGFYLMTPEYVSFYSFL